MSMVASAKAEPPESPVDVAYLPEAAMETKMFSTLCVVRESHPSHVLLKTALLILAGFQESKKPAGNDSRESQSRHVLLKLVPLEVSSNGNDSREAQPRHVL